MFFGTNKRRAKRSSLPAVMATGMAALAATASFAVPAAAEPAAAPAATTASAAFCTTGTVQAKVNGNTYSGWESYRVIGYYSKGHNYSCNGYRVGRHYDACGGGNVWLSIHTPNLDNSGYVWGWAPSNCFWNQ